MIGAHVIDSPEAQRRLSGTPLIVMLDIDGTLAPIAPRPQDAVVPRETRQLIAKLAAREGVHVVLVSGRGASDARRLVGAVKAWVIGNHGCEIVAPNGDVTIDPLAQPYAEPMRKASRRIAALVKHVRGVLLEDKTWTLSVHYRLADPAIAPRLEAQLTAIAKELGLQVTLGKMVYEVRPPVRIDKGTAVLSLVRQLGGLADDASVLFAGDDVTDEDAFRMLRQRVPAALTVRVSESANVTTAAEFVVRDPDAVREMLEWLVVHRNVLQ